MDLLFRRTWWRYDAGASAAGAAYHYFNLAEAGCWLVLAVLVAARYAKHRRSLLEPLYAGAFLLFGLTDIQEAGALTSWLIWVKLVILLALLGLRAAVIKKFYPNAKLY